MRIRSLRLLPILALVAPLILAPPARAADTTPVVIPVITSLTGSGAFIGGESQDSLRRLETAVNKRGGINGRPVHFEISDDQSKPQVAVQLVSEIEAKGYQIILGPSITNSCLAIVPFIQSKVVDYCFSPGLEPVKGSFNFATSVSGPDIFAAMVHYFHRKGWNRIATITTSDATGQQADQRLGGAIALPENKGVELVAQEHFAPSDLTVAAQIARLKAAQPNVVVAWVIGTPFVTVLRGMSDAAFEAPLFASNSNMINDQMKQWSQIMPSQLLFSGPAFLGGSIPRAERAAVDEFYSVTKGVGVTPDFPLAISWDPALVTLSALRRLGAGASAQQIHDYIEALRGFPGILGTYDFTSGNQRGLTQKDLTILRWDPAKSSLLAVSKAGGEPL